ncbi:ATP-binding cassette domain-containing protein [Kribbella sp. CA-293567]|uniref:ATP-binding cassette domain-containing protein n=1 Tax=Kribbella sp. CA-293567 TaxID=3002436 RepID=UPI0022DE9725|nr:ATP-binding cassette domain-containing protein [Kribbella sp. CA-293567]WBQ05165.1 ATP-binding cassette domain-containing protein [Kribbella sp. CA-293567]
MTTERVIEAFEVRKNYAGGKEGAGLNGFDLEVSAGTVTGLLGPNGAGKTTAVRILATLLRMDSGEARIAGYDVRHQGAEVRRTIGLVGQYAAVDEILTGKQNLVMFGRLNHLGHARATRRADELLERFGLTDSAMLPSSKYSGGMRRRLDLAASLIVAPKVLFVDEPTTGLDPAGRAEVWSAVRELVRGGTTVLLTTQYLDEADQLADRISMLREGKVVAEGTPDALKAQLGADWLDLELTTAADVPRILQLTERLTDGEIHVAGTKVSIPVKDRTRALIEVATLLQEARIEPEDITLRRPTLDEVFLHLTGDSASSPSYRPAETEVPA